MFTWLVSFIMSKVLPCEHLTRIVALHQSRTSERSTFCNEPTQIVGPPHSTVLTHTVLWIVLPRTTSGEPSSSLSSQGPAPVERCEGERGRDIGERERCLGTLSEWAGDSVGSETGPSNNLAKHGWSGTGPSNNLANYGRSGTGPSYSAFQHQLA
jgi:hypothetical protein